MLERRDGEKGHPRFLPSLLSSTVHERFWDDFHTCKVLCLTLFCAYYLESSLVAPNPDSPIFNLHSQYTITEKNKHIRESDRVHSMNANHHRPLMDGAWKERRRKRPSSIFDIYTVYISVIWSRYSLHKMKIDDNTLSPMSFKIRNLEKKILVHKALRCTLR